MSDLASWWAERTLAERDDWCSATADGAVTNEMAMTVAAERRAGGPGAWLTPSASLSADQAGSSPDHWTIEHELHAFIVVMCG
ncbi:MAG TPA: hypothetical protein VGF84_02455 [Micromonosporaceae bacterium]|jgi:hypothetical protein